MRDERERGVNEWCGLYQQASRGIHIGVILDFALVGKAGRGDEGGGAEGAVTTAVWCKLRRRVRFWFVRMRPLTVRLLLRVPFVVGAGVVVVVVLVVIGATGITGAGRERVRLERRLRIWRCAVLALVVGRVVGAFVSVFEDFSSSEEEY